MLLKNYQRTNLKTSLIKRRFDTTFKDKDGNIVTIPAKYDIHHLTVLKDNTSSTTLLQALEDMQLTKTRDLINMPCFIDLIRLSIPRDYIDENFMLPILHPSKRTPVFKTWYHGDRLHIAIMGELLNQKRDVKRQVDHIIMEIFRHAGVIPLSRRSYLNGSYKSCKSYKQNECLRNTTFKERFKAFRGVVSVSEIECAFGFHSGHGINELLLTETMFQADASHACYYTGKGGYFLCNGSYVKLPVKAYDCAEKNNLKKSAPKLEMGLTKQRFPDLSLETLRGTAQEIIKRQERRLKKELRKYVKVKSTAVIGNNYLIELLGGIPKSYSSSHYRVQSLLSTKLIPNSIIKTHHRGQYSSPEELTSNNRSLILVSIHLHTALYILSKKVINLVGKLIDDPTSILILSFIKGCYPGIPPPVKC